MAAAHRASDFLYSNAFEHHIGIRWLSARGAALPVPKTFVKSSRYNADADLLDDEEISNEITGLMSKNDPHPPVCIEATSSSHREGYSVLFALRVVPEARRDNGRPRRTRCVHHGAKTGRLEDRFESLCGGQPVNEMDAAVT